MYTTLTCTLLYNTLENISIPNMALSLTSANYLEITTRDVYPTCYHQPNSTYHTNRSTITSLHASYHPQGHQASLASTEPSVSKNSTHHRTSKNLRQVKGEHTIKINVQQPRAHQSIHTKTLCQV